MEEAKKYRQNEWEKDHKERITILTSKDTAPTKAQIKDAATEAGISVNAWILEAIKEKIEK